MIKVYFYIFHVITTGLMTTRQLTTEYFQQQTTQLVSKSTLRTSHRQQVCFTPAKTDTQSCSCTVSVKAKLYDHHSFHSFHSYSELGVFSYISVSHQQKQFLWTEPAEQKTHNLLCCQASQYNSTTGSSSARFQWHPVASAYLKTCQPSQ